ncbi:hypothetical protein RFI_06054 [Reticulomyxa filosa]|uniref:Glycoside hydrolase family 2 catalytic domain-containing protein n=1 Tax=Reticulomyxa filosa TaxID=46433 RepID=X6P0K9_RETFI|nr:hypothetical protein RFI_06054 [Reticulomyxa filosa]|eukprot:ETO31067.1 hypothetical protein RFI_06054 [Reticulomyxa filosa]
MWACANYWVRPEYLQSSAKEVRDNVRRLQYHPSIVIWAGNNENSCTANTSGEEPYRQLYFGTILNNITSLDNTRPTVASSPSNGDETEQNPCSNNPQNPFYGDVHSFRFCFFFCFFQSLYLYDIDCWNVSLYVRPRFMSEFGLQSWPSFITIKKYFPVDQLSWNSALVASFVHILMCCRILFLLLLLFYVYRQHHPDGQSQIENGIAMHYNTPDSGNNQTDFEAWLFLSQAYQGYCYKVEVEVILFFFFFFFFVNNDNNYNNNNN